MSFPREQNTLLTSADVAALYRMMKNQDEMTTLQLLMTDSARAPESYCITTSLTPQASYPYRIFLEKYRIFLQTLNPNKNPKTLNPKLQTKKKSLEKNPVLLFKLPRSVLEDNYVE
jgi:hypothetical protein